MKAIKIIAVLLVIYAGIVVAFESLLGYYQPSGQGTLVITTTDEDGTANDRVLSRIESDGRLYVAANHWPRAWYRQVLDNPAVQVMIDGERADYTAVPVTGTEHDRLAAEFAHGIVFKLLTGFPPRYFVRLEPDQLPAPAPDLQPEAATKDAAEDS